MSESARIVNSKQLRHWNLITSNRSKGLWTAAELNGWMDAHTQTQIHIQMKSCEITAINTLTNGMNMLNALCGKCVRIGTALCHSIYVCLCVWCMWKVIGAHVEFHTYVRKGRVRKRHESWTFCLFDDQVIFSSLCIYFSNILPLYVCVWHNMVRSHC